MWIHLRKWTNNRFKQPVAAGIISDEVSQETGKPSRMAVCAVMRFLDGRLPVVGQL